MSQAEEVLTRVHRVVGTALGEISLSLASRRLSRTRLEQCSRQLAEANADLRSLLDSMSGKQAGK